MLPSKKILILLALLIVFMGALAIYKYTSGSDINYDSTSNQNPLIVVSSSTTTNNFNGNSFTNGLRDSLASTSESDASTTDAVQKKLTSTDIFARDFFTQYLALKQQGVSITSDNSGQIVNDYLKTAPIPTINAKQYTVADLTIEDSSKANLLDYQNAVIAVFTKYWPVNEYSEMYILQNTFTNNDPKALAKLAITISIYESALKGCLGLTVPNLAIADHLNVLNSLSTYIQTLKSIQLAYTDPIGSLAGLSSFTTNRTNLNTSMADLRIYLINSLK